MLLSIYFRVFCCLILVLLFSQQEISTVCTACITIFRFWESFCLRVCRGTIFVNRGRYSCWLHGSLFLLCAAMIPEFIFFRATVNLILNSCYWIIFHPLLQYTISSAFSRQLICTSHLLHTYHYYSTTSHPHSVVNLYAPLICYLLTIIAVQHLICIQSSTYTHHSSATYLPLLQYTSSAFSRQLVRTTHLLTTYHYYSTTSHLHSVVKLHASLICCILTIITVQHLIHIQSSTYTHHSSATYLPLLQYNISSAFSRQLIRTTHLLPTYHYYSTTSHPHSVVNLHAPLICYILTIITVHLIRIESSSPKAKLTL